MRHEPADLVGVVFDGVDKLQHLCWRFLDPACQPPQPSRWEREVTQLCEAYFRQLDSLIEEIVVSAGPDAMIVLASDHGGGPTRDILYLNSWLEQHGYLAWSAAAEVPAHDDMRIGISQITRHVYELDWNRTVAYAATPSSFGIHLVVGPHQGGPGRTPQELQRLRTLLSAELRELRHPATGLRMVEKLETRDEVFAGPFAELAPDLSLGLADGAVISILRSDELVKQRPAPLGSHRPEGIFIASGPRVRSGADIGELSITDVAPLILYQLGLGVPDGMRGRVPPAVFESQTLLDRPVRHEPTLQAPNGAPVHVAVDAESEAVVLRRLRALGYVE
jgi:predicted AlkP superfamily phosphohydrolase/phosphomutase